MVRSLSSDQLKDIRKRIKYANRKYLFLKWFPNPHNGEGISLSMIEDELKRRKVQKLKLGELAKY